MILDLVEEENDVIFFCLKVVDMIFDLVGEENAAVFCLGMVEVILDLVGDVNDVTFDLKVVEVEERFLNDGCHL